MSDIITHVRKMIDDPNDVVFTDDEDIQDVLDESRDYLYRRLLRHDPENKRYWAPPGYGWFEGSQSSWSGDPTIALWNGRTSGATEYTPDSFNLIQGEFTFTSDQDTSLYLDGYSYDVNLAAGRLLYRMAAMAMPTGSWQNAGSAIQARDQIRTAARMYFQLARPKEIQVTRSRKEYWRIR